MFGWHHRLSGQKFELTLGNSEGHGSLAGCSPWGHKESDTTERLNWNWKGSKTDELKFMAVLEESEMNNLPRLY